MVLNQCIVKGCHSSSNEDKQGRGTGGHLHPIPQFVLDDVQEEKKWIELVKVRLYMIGSSFHKPYI